MEFINKDDRENIKFLNKHFGTDYRTTPYDINKPEDVIELVEKCSDEYRDISKYLYALVDIIEDFDESIENYHPSQWVKMGEGSTGNKTLDHAYRSLDQTIKYFRKLVDEIENNCIEIWKIALNHPSDDVLIYLFDCNKRYSANEINKVLGEFGDIVSDISNEDTEETSAKLIARTIKHKLKSTK